MFWFENTKENISRLKIFEWIDTNIVEDIIHNCEHRVFQDWEIIIMQSEESNGEWYIIKKWSVNVSIDGENIAQLQSGDIFWEIALLNEEERTASVYSNGETEVIVLKLENIMEMLSSDNQINKTIIQRIEENLERN